ncbi:replicative DNA helicase [Paenibacillus sp. UNC496MF]|uniref:DnaB-like helicase C-terminal domain-containing protein n=1 Tax=Paenibacillus sp. UNC496MF TaxID=1502753 RepID=UPI0008E4F11F|nr:DnaB-like helicase C-terminal domain-containing protein [Paenibacillus sp. UNC496MF]SFJ65567.1 replicative DNA helicase [Paenibacillus sp. UNC496MF]
MSESINFADIMRQVNEQMQTDTSIFGAEESNPLKLKVLNHEAIFGRPLSPLEQRMFQNIQNMDAYSWSRGSRGGLRSRFPQFDEGLEGGIQPGLILFAAAPNVGKSAFMLQLSKDVAECNDNVYVSYHSLDDSNNELMPRYIACDQQITIAQAKTPERFAEDPKIMEKRNEGMKNMYRRMDRFGMFDSNYTTSLEGLEEHLKMVLMTKPEGTKIVIAIDSFNDITVESINFNNNDARNEHVAKTIKSWSTQYNATVMCTAHLRKTNGRRPTVDDLKDTITLQYEATLIVLMFNEVGVKEENAQIYWLQEDSDAKMPVIEAKFGKNKHSSFKGTKFYEFIPDFSYSVESTPEAGRRYASLIYQG